MTELPDGWVVCPIGEVAQIETGNTPSKKQPEFFGGEYPFYKPGDMDAGGILTGAVETLSEQGYAVARQLPEGSVLVTCIGNLGKSGITSSPSACNQQINAILPTKAALPAFLNNWVKTIRPWMEDNASATTVTILNKGRFLTAPLPLPPLPEQRRIVAKLDRLSARSAAARDHLVHTTRRATRAKQAVLGAIFGESATSSWNDVALGSAVSDSLVGLVRSKAQQSDQGTPYIRMNHYDYAGSWNSENLTCVTTTDAEFERYELHSGDVLFNTRNSAELVGKVGLWPAEKPGHVYNNNLLRLRFVEGIAPEFAYYFMTSPVFRRYLASVTSATTSVAAIYQKSLMKAPFQHPEIERQHEIVRRIETAFARIDRLVEEASRAAALLDRLDERLLAKAFRGELVPQDPDDEPAEALLTRIRAARTADPTTKRRKA